MTDPNRRETRAAASPAGAARPARPTRSAHAARSGGPRRGAAGSASKASQTPASPSAASHATGAAPRTRTASRRRTAPSTGGVRIPKGRASSRPGGPGRPMRQAPGGNRIEPVQLRGSWLASMSWRLFVLAGVIVLAAAVVLPSLRAYFRQQEELADLRADAIAAQESVDDLTADLARWNDPAYVEAQARERLAFVYPGETPYRVIDPETVEGAAEGSVAAETGTSIEETGTWYTRLWGSVEEAGGAQVDAGDGGTAASSTKDAD